MAEAVKSSAPSQNGPTAGAWLQRPIIDKAAIRDWCEDLAPADIADVLACVPAEAETSLSEIRHAIDISDLALVKRVAHRLKGMAGNLGAPRLASICLEIERVSESITVVEKQMISLRQTVDETLLALRNYG